MSSAYRQIKIFESLDALEQVFHEKTLRVLRIGDQKVCIAKADGSYFAFEALCPHQRQPLAEGSLNAFGEVICPLHAYRFNLKTGQEANRLCRDLKAFPLETTDQGVFIRIY